MSWELEFLLWLQHIFSADWLKTCMILITLLGNAGLIWLVIIGYVGVVRKEKRQAIVLLAGLVLVAVIGNLIIKNIFMRSRPFEIYPYVDLLIKAPKDFSFPSGHTSTSFVVATILGYYYPKQRKYVFLLASLIALSRMVLFVHFPTDILVGLVLGLASGYFMIMLDQNGWFSKWLKF